ncbi:hypothetical protein MTO96_014419 [Rhipicephalus appendiculatus]
MSGLCAPSSCLRKASQLPPNRDVTSRSPSTLVPTVMPAAKEPSTATAAGGGVEGKTPRAYQVPERMRSRSNRAIVGYHRRLQIGGPQYLPVSVGRSPSSDNTQTPVDGSGPKASPSGKTLPTPVRNSAASLTNLSERPPLLEPSDLRGRGSSSSLPYSRSRQLSRDSIRESHVSPGQRGLPNCIPIYGQPGHPVIP